MGNNITSTPSREEEAPPDLHARRRNAVPVSSFPEDEPDGTSSGGSGSLLASTPSSGGGARALGLHHRAISALLDGSGSGSGAGVFGLTPEMVRGFVLKATLRGRNRTYIRQIANPPDPPDPPDPDPDPDPDPGGPTGSDFGLGSEPAAVGVTVRVGAGEPSGEAGGRREEDMAAGAGVVDEAERVVRLKLQSVLGRYAALLARIRGSDESSEDATDETSEVTALAQVLSHADRMWSEILSPSGVMDVQKGVQMVGLFREEAVVPMSPGVDDVVVSDFSDDEGEDDAVDLVPEVGIYEGFSQIRETEEEEKTEEVPVSECVRFGLIHFLGEKGSGEKTVASSLRLLPALVVSNLLLSFGPASICWPLVLTSEDEPRGPFEMRIKDIVFCTIPISPIPGLMISEGFWKGLCQEIVRWNSEILFESKEYDGSVANAMTFVRSVVGCADVPVDAAFLPTSPLGMLTAWYDENPATCLYFIPDEMFMEHYGLRKDVYRFKTHAQLDEFVESLVETDEYSLNRRFAEERSILAAYDAGFWSQRAIRNAAIFDPKFHDGQAACPFRSL